MSVRNTITLALALLLSFSILAGVAEAGKGGRHSSPTGSGTLTLVLLNSTDGLPHFGQVVTFNVATSAAYPYVTLNCYKDGAWVYTLTAGFYAAYPFTRYYSLGSSSWTSGAADCTADLHYSTSNGSKVTLATLNMHVEP